MRCYLAGPMRGYKNFNFPAFHAAAAKLRADGHEVFNPAERDIERHGVDISKGNETGGVLQAQVAHGFNLRVALGEDLEWICRHADAVYLLPNWRNSKGATAERAVALALGLLVVELPEPRKCWCGVVEGSKQAAERCWVRGPEESFPSDHVFK